MNNMILDTETNEVTIYIYVCIYMPSNVLPVGFAVVVVVVLTFGLFLSVICSKRILH